MSAVTPAQAAARLDAHLPEVDPNLFGIIEDERERQRGGLELIASENYTSRAVMEAAGTCLTNKYAEGYPGRRYYGGCEFVDEAENLARDRAKSLFGAEHANVQPHAGSQANFAAFTAFLDPGDTFLAMDLAHGGHLTHGMHLNVSGQLYNPVHYGVREDDHRIDFDQVAKLAREHRPKMIVAGASAYPREIPHARFAQIAEEVGAVFLVDMAHYSGLVAAGVHDDPVPVADVVTSTTHKTLRGPRSGMILCREEHAKAIDRQVFPGSQGGPLMHVVAAKAVCFAEAARPEFRDYAERTVANAKILAEVLAAGGVRLISGGTDNHMVLTDVTSVGLTGKIAEKALDAAGVTVNKNMIPYDRRKPLDPSGIRFGTPALTTRGMGGDEMRRVGAWILEVFGAPEDDATLGRVAREVGEFCADYPVPGVG